jgi:hypothetical protein
MTDIDPTPGSAAGKPSQRQVAVLASAIIAYALREALPGQSP